MVWLPYTDIIYRIYGRSIEFYIDFMELWKFSGLWESFEKMPASECRFNWKWFARLIGAEIRAVHATDLSSDGNRAADRIVGLPMEWMPTKKHLFASETT